MTTIDQQLFELICRAPAVPEWFFPKEGPRAKFFSWEDYDKARIIQWPSAYARMVMEAAK